MSEISKVKVFKNISSDIVLIDPKQLNFMSEISLNSCVICIANKGTISIYDETSEITLAEKIKSFADLTITTDFPNSVCANCEQNVTNCYKLKIQIQNSIKTFTLMHEKKKNIKCQSKNINISNNEQQESIDLIQNNKLQSLPEVEPEPESQEICTVFLPQINFIEIAEYNGIKISMLNENVEKTADMLGENKLINSTNNDETLRKDTTLLPLISSKHKCEKCNKVFKRKITLLRHKLIHRGENHLYECDVCKKSFKLKSQMNSHKRYHNIVKNLICEVCSGQFKSMYDLKNHKLIHGPPKFKCTESDCNKLFHNPLCLRKHLVRHKGIRFPCDQCESNFSSDVALRTHKKRIHLGIKRFKCLICKKEYFSLYNYQIHMRIHTGEKPYSCEICDKKYTTRTQLNKHLNSKHNIDLPDRNVAKKKEQYYECDKCEKKISSLSSFKRHILTHSGKNRVQCEVCKKTLSNSVHLKNHMRIHTGDTRYECHICKKTLVSPYALECHIRIHTGEKPYKCQFCPEAFKAVSGLIVHERKHNGIKHKECTICQKALNSDAHLKVHMRKHTGEKPFACPFCNKKFSTNGYLTVHIRIHKGEKRFSCNECDARYDRLSHLNAHIEKQHIELLEIEEDEYSNEELLIDPESET